ncbi:MAG TPA: hypothetical protein VFH92_07115 [Phenylobacterium sp.]|nr:hypothetical protein [Phenylobacterium sp.]
MPAESFLRFVRRLALAFAALLALVAPAAAADAQGGPKELLIAYRAQPADRPAFRAYLLGEETAFFEGLKRDGVLKSYQVLFNPFVTGTWDAMTVLSFTNYGATARWKEIERTRPGGLSAAGLKLAKPLETYSADLGWEGVAAEAGAPAKRIVYVIPYSYTALDQYKSYVDAYVIPQVKGWMAEGVLSRYALYLNRDPVGDPWDALFVYEYRDQESFGRREEVVAKVRAPLREDPTWKHWNDIKATVRSETQNTQAEILSPAK